MNKRMKFQHLDKDTTLTVDFLITQEDGHWVARLRYLDEENSAVKAPTFYGQTAEQAERQLRKVFEKEYDLVAETPLAPEES